MTREERYFEELKALRKFAESKNRNECFKAIAVFVERIEQIDANILQAQVSFN